MSTGSSSSNAALQKPEQRQFKLVRASVDWTTAKTHLFVGAGLALILCTALYAQTTGIGFLSADFVLLRAASASAASGFDNVSGLVTSSALAHACGPLPMFVFVCNWLVWHSHSFWYHCENILLLTLSAVLVGQISSQISALRSNRLGGVGALWAMIIFCLYPGFSEAASWITGINHLILLVTYLASVFFYFRFRVVRERGYLWLCLISSAAAYLTAPGSWSLPLTITLAEYILFDDSGITKTKATSPTASSVIAESSNEASLNAEARSTDQSAPRTDSKETQEHKENGPTDEEIAVIEASLKKVAKPVASPVLNNTGTVRIIAPLFCWAVMFFIFTLSMLIPAGAPVAAAIREHQIVIGNIFQPAVFLGLLLPQALAIDIQTSGLQWTSCAAVGSALLILLIKVLRHGDSFRTFIWLFLWLVFAASIRAENSVTEQALVGNTAPYLAAAPLSIFLALAALPAAGGLAKKPASAVAAGGTLIMLALAGCWAFLSMANVRPWIEAGDTMKSFRQQINKLATKSQNGKQITLADLPPSRDGISLFPDESVIATALAPPFSPHDYSALWPQSIGAQQNNFVWPGLLRAQLAAGSRQQLYVWNSDTREYAPYKGNNGAGSVQAIFNKDTVANFSFQPQPGMTGIDRGTAGFTQNPTVTPLKDVWRIAPGRTGITVWLPNISIDPMRASVAGMKLLYTSPTGCHNCTKGEMHLVWQGTASSNATNGQAARQTEGEATIFNQSFGEYVVWLGRYPSWTFSRTIDKIGIRLAPGNYFADIQTLDVLPAEQMQPQVFIREAPGKIYGATLVPIKLKAGTSAEILFDTAKIPTAVGTKLAIYSGDASFAAKDEHGLYELAASSGREIFNADFPSRHSSVSVPPSLMRLRGQYKIRAAALDKNASMIGIPTEPITISVE